MKDQVTGVLYMFGHLALSFWLLASMIPRVEAAQSLYPSASAHWGLFQHFLYFSFYALV